MATTAGIMGAKRTSELIPMCHILPITKCRVNFEMKPEECAIDCYCTVKVTGKTGVEMEALTGVSVALLTVYDMCKAIDKSMEIGEIYLCHKSGGKSSTAFAYPAGLLFAAVCLGVFLYSCFGQKAQNTEPVVFEESFEA